MLLRKLAMLAVVLLMFCVPLAHGQSTWNDNFEDGVINPTLWAWAGERFGIGGCGAGSWDWSHEEIVAPDGYLSMRVWGPTSANTFGGQAWVRTLFDYNDGGNHIINFRWGAEVNATHIDSYAIQITDGTNPVCELFWYNNHDVPIDGPTWKNLYAQWNQPDMDPSDWSIHIDGTNNTATLFDGPDLTGVIIGSKALPTDQAWYVRFIHQDGTSSGFPAGDNLLNLYDFCSAPTTENGPCETDCSELDDDCSMGTCILGMRMCAAMPVNEGGSCDDGNLCTLDDACNAGTCLGALVDCSVLNGECTLGVCNPADGVCLTAAINEGGVCDDGGLCTEGDVCAAGTCLGTLLDCSGLDDECNEGACVQETGDCFAVPINDGICCSDDDQCTESDMCNSGVCMGDLSPVCVYGDITSPADACVGNCTGVLADVDFDDILAVLEAFAGNSVCPNPCAP